MIKKILAIAIAVYVAATIADYYIHDGEMTTLPAKVFSVVFTVCAIICGILYLLAIIDKVPERFSEWVKLMHDLGEVMSSSRHFKFDENENERQRYYEESWEFKNKYSHTSQSYTKSERERQKSETKPKETELGKAYRTLKVSATASDNEVTEAWRKLIIEWHPDRFESKGEESIRKATENSKRINEAYDRIARARGIR